MEEPKTDLPVPEAAEAVEVNHTVPEPATAAPDVTQAVDAAPASAPVDAQVEEVKPSTDEPVKATEDVLAPVKEDKKPNSASTPARGSLQQDSEHQLSLLRRLAEVWESDPSSCDVTLVGSDGTEVPLHSVIARALAPGIVGFDKQRIELPSVSGKILPALVRYLYTGELRIDSDSAGDMLSGATALGIKGAQQLCGRYLRSSITAANVLKRQAIATEHDLSELLSSSLDFIDRKFDSVVLSKEWLQLPKAQVAAILSRNSLMVEGEEPVYQALKRWEQHDKPSRHADYLELLQDAEVVRLPFLGSELVASLDKDPEVIECPAAKAVVHEELVRRLLGKENTAIPRGSTRVKEAEEKCLGKRVKKKFEDGKLYQGKITGVAQEVGTGKLLFNILYDDGDGEDVYEAEVEEMLRAAGKRSSGTPKAKKPAAKKTPAKATPKKNTAKKRKK
uniref:Ring canal kelch n=1 Tax=Tetraselmis sp. GSL018 TaxID=582737 RepID=A0A061QXA1_9CHLO|mmetsp:Transcript_20418/g.48604  ORF Transcript_20418/g.48604 Transcript_20418/m.48604 type:complete len:449 (+) Transcript_20418:74-1420(+)|eukprot:CAMPEP_0177608522 /NCGR_PEP_ID=MMETSP0419_2-20121207/18519_1 /TAXON_ID=582737 /ORGANISM="Tetraselmis sp., Strain GSL018" /LENGTH=448 /DNA_ID=CAMNT_0019103223 /DNA_START=61 /DNA_END=1407 /DNA_ORIENTATION=+